MRNLTCPECGAAFSVQHNRKTIYCSDRCRHRAKTRARGPAHRCQCAVCGVKFKGWDRQKYCPDCWVRRRAQPRKPSYERVPPTSHHCATCGVAFVGRRTQRFCTERCSYIAKGVTPPGETRIPVCKWCGTLGPAKRKQGPWTCEPCKQTNARATKRRRKQLERGTVEPYTREYIFTRDRWRCHLCNGPVRRDAEVPHPKAPTIDHLVPLSLGGVDAPHNVRCAHFLYNSLKSDRAVGEQLLLVG